MAMSLKRYEGGRKQDYFPTSLNIKAPWKFSEDMTWIHTMSR